MVFYKANASTLGEGKWAQALDSNARFLMEHLVTSAPSAPQGRGRDRDQGRDRNGRDRDQGRDRNRDRGSDKGRGGGRDQERHRSPCMSRLDKEAVCGRSACRFSHACGSCGGPHAAADCGSWDASRVEAKHGDILKKIREAQSRKRQRN